MDPDRFFPPLEVTPHVAVAKENPLKSAAMAIERKIDKLHVEQETVDTEIDDLKTRIDRLNNRRDDVDDMIEKYENALHVLEELEA